MFSSQQILKENWKQMVEILESYEAKDNIISLKAPVDNFVMKVPLVGLFSAGKSSLINTLIGEKLLSVQISPETAIATEFYYTEDDDCLIGHKPNGETITLSKDELRQQDLGSIMQVDANGNQGWVEARLNTEVLSKFPHISLVDLPGLDSNLVSHNEIIDNYIDQSLAYVIVVSVEDGEVRESTRQFLKELNLNQMPVILVLTKSDLKHADDISLIQNKIEQTVTDLLGKPPLRTTVVNRKGANLNQLVEAFQAIEAKSEAQFNMVVTSKIIEQLAFTEQNLDKLLNMDDVSIETLEAEKQALKQDILAFSQKINKDSLHLQSQSKIVIRRITDSLESNLKAELDFLARQLLAQQDVSYFVTNIARLTVSEGLQEELAPLLKSYIDNIQSEMPASIQIEKLNLDIAEENNSDLKFENVVITIAPILALLKINPIISAISTVVVPALAKLADLFLSKNQREAQQLAREESAKNIVLCSVIPKVRHDIENALQSIVTDNINSALENMQALVTSREQQVNAQIEQKEQDIQTTKAQREQRHQVYLQDKATLSTLRQQLIEAMA